MREERKEGRGRRIPLKDEEENNRMDSALKEGKKERRETKKGGWGQTERRT